MSQHRTAYDEALDAMLEAGISRGRADELLLAVWDQAQAAREIERKQGVPAPGEVFAKDLVIGDIVEESYGAENVSRKIVINLTEKSAVFRTDYGQDGRASYTLKRKGKAVDRTVKRIGHTELGEAELDMLANYYRLGSMTQARWERGLVPGVRSFYALFGYEEGQVSNLGTIRWEKEGDLVATLDHSDTGDRVIIKRDPNQSVYVDGKPVTMTCWGAYALDPEHGHAFACLGWRYRDREAALKAGQIYFGARMNGVSREQAAWVACDMGNNTLPLVDRWREEKA